MENKILDTTTQSQYAAEIALILDKLPQSEESRKALRRVWKILLHLIKE